MKLIPNETPKSLIQSYYWTECILTFDGRQKLKNHTREQHKGKFLKSTERKFGITETKTNMKLPNQTKKSFKNKLLQREKK